MPSIPHRTDPGHGILQRAKSGLAVLPAGIVAWFDDWRVRRHIGELDDYLLRDIGLRKADLRRSIVATRRRESKPQATKDTLIWQTI